MSAEDRRVVGTFADAFLGPDRPLIVASGIGIFPDEVFIGPVMPAFLRATELATMAMADRGVRAAAVGG